MSYNKKYPLLDEYFVQECNTQNPLFFSEETLEKITNIVLEEAGFKWIPVSERLPDIIECEVTYSFLYERRRICEATYLDGEFEASTHYGTVKINHAGGTINIFAWRPLPKPYDPNP